MDFLTTVEQTGTTTTGIRVPRSTSRSSAGDSVRVDVALETDPREVEVP